MMLINFLIFYFGSIACSYAYLDPGTGSFLLQTLAIILATIVTFFKFSIKKISNFKNYIKIRILKLFKKKN